MTYVGTVFVPTLVLLKYVLYHNINELSEILCKSFLCIELNY